MLATKPVVVQLHCPACGRAVMIEYYRDIQSESAPSPVWRCPHFECDSDRTNPLIGAREIIGVRPVRRRV